MKNTIEILRKVLSPLYDAGEVKAITRLLLEEICGLTYAQILLNEGTKKLPREQAEILEQYAQRLAKGEPVQQVMGYTWFRGRKFKVNRDVLVPRPETGELVQKVVDNFVNKSGITLLDIGTGSGCIALSLAAEINHSFITAIDLSTAALKTAQENAKELNISNIEFVQADILKLAENADINWFSTFDAIVSNPPYICQHEAVDMSKNVLDYEPSMALFVPDDDPLLFYRAIGQYAQQCLKNGGKLFFEINEAYGQEVCRLLESQSYQQVQLHQDQFGKDRFVLAEKNNSL